MSGSTVMIAVDSAGTGLERLKLDASQKLTVSDSTAQASLSTLETNTTGLATESTLASVATESTLALVATESTLSTLATETTVATLATESTLSTVSTDISSIDAKVPSQGSAVSASSLPVVIASDQATVPVSVSASSASATTVFNAQSVASSATANSTSVDLNTVRDGISVFGNFGDTSAQIQVGMSSDNSTWYISDEFHYVDGSTGDFGFTLPSFGARYIRLTVTNSDVASQTITAIISTK
jgi:hypothetical protein